MMNLQSMFKHHRKWVGSLVIGGVGAVTAWLAVGNRWAAAQPTVVTAAVAEPALSSMALPLVTADGYLVPGHYAQLSFAASNVVAEIHVTEGEWVAAGTPLVTLENSAQQAMLAQAAANLAQTAANLDELRAGARSEDIAQAQAAVAVAEMNLYRLVDGATPEQIASADQAIAVAQANLNRVAAGPTPDEVTAATAALYQAEAELRNAQSAYDQVAWANDIGARPESLRLEQATIEYERAQAQSDNVINGATTEDIAIAQAQVRQAQAAKNELLAAAHPADVATAQANLQAAQAGLDLLLAGARPEEIAAAEAQVAAAQAARLQAQAAVDETVLAAPFAGTISAIEVEVGEFVAPGMLVLKLGNSDTWVVETDDLSELDVVKLREHDAVEVTLDALPGVVLHGTIQHIQPASEFKRGDVTYTATVTLDATELDAYAGELRWGMTAAVNKY